MSRWRITIVSWHLKWPDFKFSLNSTFTTASIIKVSIPFFFFFVFLKNGKQAGLLNGFYFVSFTYVIWWYLWPCCTADPDPTNIWLILEIKKPFLCLTSRLVRRALHSLTWLLSASVKNKLDTYPLGDQSRELLLGHFQYRTRCARWNHEYCLEAAISLFGRAWTWCTLPYVHQYGQLCRHNTCWQRILLYLYISLHNSFTFLRSEVQFHASTVHRLWSG